VFLDYCPKKILLFNLFVFVPNDFTFFFLNSRKYHPWKVYFMDPGERVKPRLSQAFTRDARLDSNSRFTVQISSFLSSRHVGTPNYFMLKLISYIYIYIYITTLYFCHAFYFHYFPGSYAQKSLFSFVHKVYKACDNV
jgi:hypothetical protein